jgi:hypothetical protein
VTPGQQETYDAILGMAHRVAERIAKLPRSQRAGATTVAQATIMESVANHGITEPELVSMFAVAIALALHESDAPGDQLS